MLHHLGCIVGARQARGAFHAVDGWPGHVLEMVMVVAHQVQINRPIAAVLEGFGERVVLDLQFSDLWRETLVKSAELVRSYRA